MLLEKLTKICLGFDGAECERNGSHATFRARKKVFAYFLDNHHGDGIVAVACKVNAGDNTALIQAQPERFCMPAYIGSRGWVSLRLDVGKVDWTEVKEFVGESYRLTVEASRKVSTRHAERVRHVRRRTCLRDNSDSMTRQKSALVRVEGRWVHLGVAPKGFDWTRHARTERELREKAIWAPPRRKRRNNPDRGVR